MEKKTGQVVGSTHWYLWSALVAIELLMSFSAFGYVHIPPLSVTIAYVPVLVAGALMGPLEAMTVGAVFGAASMWKATATYVMPFDQLFSPFFSGYPVQSVLLSVGSRMLFGLTMGLLYTLVRRWRFSGVWVGLLTFFGSTVHSFFVYSSLWLFFPQTGYTPANALGTLGSPSGLATSVVITTVVLLLWRLEASKTWRKFQAQVEEVGRMYSAERYHRVSLLVAVVVTLASSVSVALYFVHRMESVLEFQGVELPPLGYSDLVHLQIQFLIGILSLMWIVAVFVIFNRRYATYMAQEAKRDFLTGLLSRKAFMTACAAALEEFPKGGGAGCFLMVDLDHFKEINDGFGHPEGDRILREVSRCLQECFGPEALLGRVGGDEFAVFLQPNLSLEEWKVCLRHFQESARLVEPPSGARRLSCSVGVLLVKEPRPVEELYRDADWLLYQAKAQGRDRYVAGTQEDARAGVHAQAG